MTLTSHHVHTELQKMIKDLCKKELQSLLNYGCSKSSSKKELQAKALALLKAEGPQITSLEMKIRELHRNRYQQTNEHVPPELYSLDMCSLPNEPNENNSMSQYPVNPGVHFKELPFFDVLNKLLKPTSLPTYTGDCVCFEKEFLFYLGPQDLKQLKKNSDYQIQFRIARLGTNSKQDDEFPSHFGLKVNNKPATLPNPVPIYKPIDITSLINHSSTEPQVLTVCWKSCSFNEKYIAGVFLVHKLSSSVLINRLKQVLIRNPFYTTAMIKKKFLFGDSKLATSSLCGSLICPLSKIKMNLPCRTLKCTHLQCFDAEVYIQMNEKEPKWICPVCDKPAEFKSLAIDGFFFDIIKKVPPECTEVQIHESGSWAPVIPVKRVPEINEVEALKVENVQPKKSVEVLDLDTDNDTENSWPVLPPKKRPYKPVGIINPVMLNNAEISSNAETPVIPVTKGPLKLQKMIEDLRVSDLQILLIYGGEDVSGEKTELQVRALNLLETQGPYVSVLEEKIRELHRNRYQLTIGHVNPPQLYSSDMYSNGHNDTLGSNFSNISNHKSSIEPGVGTSFNAQMLNHQMIKLIPDVNVMSQYPVNPDVHFKDLPFYVVLNELLKPTTLVPLTGDCVYQENEFVFYLGSQDLWQLDRNSDYQVQFRIACLGSNREQDDEFPSNICLKVNNKRATLPNPNKTDKPGIEVEIPKPVDITSLIKHCLTEPQVLTVCWIPSTNKLFVAGVFLVYKQSSNVLINRLKDGVQNPNHTIAMIKEKFLHDRDSELATMSLCGSLICPLSKTKMTFPCRALTCTHLQCFDALVYIQMNEKKPKWICPVCNKSAIFKTLVIDGLFLDVIKKVPPECTEVQFHESGSWTVRKSIRN